MFKRNKENLFYTYTLSLVDALQCKTIQVYTLDNRVLNIFLDEIVSPNTVKIIKGEGLYFKNSTENKGDLYISFNILFPKYLPPENKERISTLLEDLN